MAKRKARKVDSSAKILKYIAWVLSFIALALSLILAGYYFGYFDSVKDTHPSPKKHKKEIHKSVNEKLIAVLKKEKIKKVIIPKKIVIKKEAHKFISASHELDYNDSQKVPKALPRPIKLSSSKPKLAIIIDDVGTQGQVDAINSLHLVLTKSFLPPSKNRPHTPKLASKEPFYMVHLPMEAQSFRAEEPHTLRVNDSKEKIFHRIDTIKKLFPKVKYINNHTGSKFTSSEQAMNRLIYALVKHKIHFIDSRTTAKTQAPKVMKNFGLEYVARDVFLDHHMDKAYVLKQIKQAVKVAKLHGTAIAIGHPHPNTLQALQESKKILQEVDLVLVNRLY